MKHFMFGFDDKHPEVCAAKLKAQGIDAVVLGNADAHTEKALAENGIELYLCYGAHGLGEDFAAEEHLARDPFSRPTRWFGSGCPNDAEIVDARLNAVLEKAKKLPTLKGIFVDGARFASFASVEGAESFFSCFCPRCMAKMEMMGFDAENIRAAVGRLMETRRVADADRLFLQSWFAFREACVKEYMEKFAAAVHALPGGLLAGAFVFAPSLGAYVGQTESACAPLDVVSHMIYRAYPHADGPACLGHEWARALELFGYAQMHALAECACHEKAGMVPEKTPEELLVHGFAPDRIGAEVAAVSRALNGRLAPILQIEDDLLQASADSALAAGAEGVGYFAYSLAPEKRLAEV